jgi:flagellar hook-basal body complex protein FliE
MMDWAIESVAAVAAQTQTPTANAGWSNAAPTAAPGAFEQILQRELGQLDTNLATAESAMRELAAGKKVELHEVMISLERARIGVQTFVQVRNKLIESYQDLLRMQL